MEFSINLLIFQCPINNNFIVNRMYKIVYRHLEYKNVYQKKT